MSAIPANAAKLAGATYAIPTTRIEPDPDQPRKMFDPEYIAGLAESIKAEGLLQPITVRKNPEKDGFFLIIAGECRWRAHCHAGLPTVKCLVSSTLEDSSRRFLMQTVENMSRADMTLREEATALKRLSDDGMTDEKISKAVGLSPHRVRNVIMLLELSPEIWKLLDGGSVPRAFAEGMMARKMSNSTRERFLIHYARHGMRSAYAAIAEWELERSQEAFSLLESTTAKPFAKDRDDIALKLAGLLMQVAPLIRGLSKKESTLLSTSLGQRLAEALPPGSDYIPAVNFLWHAGDFAGMIQKNPN